ncbi:unnamed protein product [Closterium sp. Naga37s-1]|nr:unnamed protein product [Closterium sp. Naga37s-1]
MAAEPTTFLPGPLPVDTSHILQCPTSASPFLQELRARWPVNENDLSNKLPQIQAIQSAEHADNATRLKITGDATRDDMKTDSVASEPERGLTENHAHTYVSSGSACVDFLFHVLPQTERNGAHRRLEAAWAEDPATALRLVMQLRAVRGTGKSDRSSFFHCVTWLYQHHPRTLLENLWLVPEFGCFKDLLEIVRLALAEEGVYSNEEEGKKMRKKGRGGLRFYGGWEFERSRAESVAEEWLNSDENDAMAWNEMVKRNSWEGSKSDMMFGKEKQKLWEEWVAEERRQMKEEKEEKELLAAVPRKERRARRAAEVAYAYESSERLRAVHNAVAAIFAAALKGDQEAMRAFEERRARKNAEGEGSSAEEAMEEDANEQAGKKDVVKAEAEGEGRKEEMEEKGGDGENGGKGKKKRKWMGRPAPRLSLAAKWAPSPGKSFDQSTLLTSSIALLLFPPSSSSSPSPSSAAAAAAAAAKSEVADSGMDVDGGAAAGGGGGYVRVAKERLQREVLAPLRRVLEVPEVHMSSGRWEHVAYGRVPSVCMNKTRKLFLSHDQPRFTEYLEDVKGGRAKIAAGALLPHEVVEAAKAAAEDGDENDTVGELQWKAMVGDIRSKGSLGNSMAVCDVSGSMTGTPMEVAIALSLLVSEVSSNPWKNHLITFSAQPRIHHVQGETLVERVRSTQGMPWGYNTNFQAVFDLLLSRAQQFQLDPPDMVQRLYVFSDMQFDEAGRASGADWETDHQAIVRKFTAAGYPVPQIVYWNLRGDARVSSTPVLASEDGVAMVSGFSKGMLLAVMEGKEISPMGFVFLVPLSPSCRPGFSVPSHHPSPPFA